MGQRHLAAFAFRFLVITFLLWIGAPSGAAAEDTPVVTSAIGAARPLIATHGYEFTANRDIRVVALGLLDFSANGFADLIEHDVALWTVGGTPLAAVTVPRAGGDRLVDSYQYVTLDSPVDLTAGQQYVLGASYCAQFGVNTCGLDAAYAIGNVFSTDTRITINNGRFGGFPTNPTLGFPGGMLPTDQARFGPNMLIVGAGTSTPIGGDDGGSVDFDEVTVSGDPGAGETSLGALHQLSAQSVAGSAPVTRLNMVTRPFTIVHDSLDPIDVRFYGLLEGRLLADLGGVARVQARLEVFCPAASAVGDDTASFEALATQTNLVDINVYETLAVVVPLASGATCEVKSTLEVSADSRGRGGARAFFDETYEYVVSAEAVNPFDDPSQSTEVTTEELCGDGAIDPGEGCDDGNTASGDGCSPICTIDADFSCDGEPSVCSFEGDCALLPGQYTLTMMANNSTQTSQDSLNRDFGPPSLNNNGIVAFSATFDDGDLQGQGLFLADGTEATIGDYVRVAHGASAFDATSFHQMSREMGLNDANQVAFVGAVNPAMSGDRVTTGLFVGAGGETAVNDYTFIAGDRDLVAGSAFISFNNIPTTGQISARPPSINNAGLVAFTAQFVNFQGIFLADGTEDKTDRSTYTTIATGGFFSPVFSGGMNGLPTALTSDPTPVVAFPASILPNDSGVFTGDGTLSVPTVIGDYTTIYDSLGGLASGFRGFVMNEHQRVAFRAATDTGEQLILIGDGTEGVLADYTVVATQTPGTNFADGLAMNDSDMVAFLVSVSGGKALYVGHNGVVRKVIETGDTLFGRKVGTQMTLARDAMNAAGQLAFRTQLVCDLGPQQEPACNAVPFDDVIVRADLTNCPVPTPIPTLSATPTPTPTPTLSATTTATVTPTVTPTVTATPTPTATVTSTATATTTVTTTPTATLTAAVTPTPVSTPSTLCEDLGGDVDADGVCGDVDNCPTDANADQENSDCDDPDFFLTAGACDAPPANRRGCCDGGDRCDVCPARGDNDRCDPDGSAAGTIGPAGGQVGTNDGSVVVDVPPGALAEETTISVTENGPANQSFTLRSSGVLSVSLRPEGQQFLLPVHVTFRWDDRDADGRVDLGTCQAGTGTESDLGLPCDENTDCESGDCSVTTNVPEDSLVLKRNNDRFSARGFGPAALPFACPDHLVGDCTTTVASCADLPGTGTATVAHCCDPAANTWSFQTCNFSELTLGAAASGLVPGKGSPRSDCVAEWAVDNPLNEPSVDHKGLTHYTQGCTDGDAVCDRDATANGVCVFGVGICLNVDDARLVRRSGAACSSTDVSGWTLRKPRTGAHRPVRAGNAARLIEAVAALGSSSIVGRRQNEVLFAPPMTEAACSALVDVEVPLKGRSADRSGTTELQARVRTTAGTPDGDRLRLQCLPAN